MVQGGRRFLGLWSWLVVPLAIAGSGLDLLPANLWLLRTTSVYELGPREDDIDEFGDDDVWIASPRVRPLRGRATRSLTGSPRLAGHVIPNPSELATLPLPSRRAIATAAAAATPLQFGSIRLCRFLC
jgi:hypothetical protein